MTGDRTGIHRIPTITRESLFQFHFARLVEKNDNASEERKEEIRKSEWRAKSVRAV